MIEMEDETLIRDIRRHIVRACIQWARTKGYSDSAGVLRGLVVLAEEPVSLDDLTLETGYSKSTVSLNIRLLENLGLVKRVVVPGEKRHLYAPIVNKDIIWANALDSVNREIQLFCEALDRTEKELEGGEDKSGYLVERVANLKESYECGKKMIAILRIKPLEQIQRSLE